MHAGNRVIYDLQTSKNLQKKGGGTVYKQILINAN